MSTETQCGESGWTAGYQLNSCFWENNFSLLPLGEAHRKTQFVDWPEGKIKRRNTWVIKYENVFLWLKNNLCVFWAAWIPPEAPFAEDWRIYGVRRMGTFELMDLFVGVYMGQYEEYDI